MPAPNPPKGAIWTIGHSTHSLPEFLAILEAHGIETVADVRRFPGSRRHPQFGSEALEQPLRLTASPITGSRNWAAGGAPTLSTTKAPPGGIRRSGHMPSIFKRRSSPAGWPR